MTPASNDGRTFNVPQLLGSGFQLSDSGPDLLRANSARDSGGMPYPVHPQPTRQAQDPAQHNLPAQSSLRGCHP